MKRFFRALMALCLLSGSAQAILQVDVDASLFPTGHGPESASMTLFGNPTVWNSTLLAGPDGFPLAYHLIFNYDAQIAGGAVNTLTFTAGSCSKTWTPTMFSTFYQQGPAFPVIWNSNGTVAPDNNPLDLCTCWPADPACQPPACSVSVESLDFGTPQPNTPVTRTFTITNTGGGTLSGTVSESCDQFSVLSGATYSLSNGQSQTVTVQFLGTAPGGPFTCTLDTGGDCVDVALTASVDQLPACELDVTSLDFGTTNPNVPVTRTFTITNTGGGTLSGTAAEACSYYAITAPLTYSLTAGQSRTFTVTFQGVTPNTYPCTISVGGSCGSVSATGVIEALPACNITPTTLNFGSAQPNTPVTRTFSITNTGGGTLSGAVSETCAGYSFVGETAYALTAGQSQTFTVEFQHGTPGVYTCTLDGGACADVSCTATVEQPPACTLSVGPTGLDFGHVYVGETASRSFTVTNSGQGTLTGSFTPNCGTYEITEGATYSLGANQSQTVTVAFAPTEPHSSNCDLVGTTCADVPLTATADFAPVCSLSTASLDFGSMQPGTPVERTFTITNMGGSLLGGELSTDCAGFSITNGVYSLAANESHTVTVAFQGATPGPVSCTLAGGVCADIACSATVEVATACSVDVSGLDFGLMQANTPVDRDFTITNNGGGTLTGTVVSPCTDFMVISDADYTLGAGHFQTFTVRFTGATPNAYTCTLDLGSALCSDLPMSAVVDEAPACAVSPESLDFGLVYVGTPVERTITVTNAGGGVLEGTLDVDCVDFSLVGSGAYSLTEGASATFTLSANPAAAGPMSCTVFAGLCGLPLTGTASAAPVCVLDTDSLDFGNVYPNVASNRTFTITNTGGGVLEGSVVESCDAFTVVSGGTFALANGESQTVTLRMLSATQGTFTCQVQATTYCDPIVCTGIVEAPATCSVEPGFLDFGTLLVGESDTLSFTITNVGGYVLSGVVSESCDDFVLITEPNYNLTAGQSHQVVVQFNATASGAYACPIIGVPSCVNAVVPCIANVLSPDDCAISVESLDFGLTQLGTPVTRTFTITNMGQARLTGTVAFSGDAQFQIVSGGTYDLAHNQHQTVTVRLLATQLGDYTCTLDPDLPCGVVTCTGSVEPAPACLVEPASIDFGLQYPNSPAVRNFTITNTGYGTLSGAVAAVCGNFVLTSPANYSLTHGQSQTFTVDFLAADTGDLSCLLDLGGICADLPLSGRVEGYPACTVSAIDGNFGTVLPGTQVTRSFTITNSGGHTLSGTVTEDCAAFSVSGGAVYNLGMGESQTVTLAFQADEVGSYSCNVDTGGDCADISVAGAVDLAPACAISESALDFGILLPGEAATRSFTITNTGGFTLAGEVSVDCEGFSILSGAVYELAHNESQSVVVQLQSSATGSYACTLNPGGDCSVIALSGAVQLAPQCVVGASLLDFGLLLPNEEATRTFTISNAGGHLLTGSVLAECAGVTVTNGDYSLAMGESQTITVGFAYPETGEFTCTVSTGGDCDGVTLVAEVQIAPSCQLSAGSLDFGTVLPNTPVVREFTITNAGGHTLSGEVTESCGAYTVANGSYTLGSGQSQTVTVTFLSAVAGTFPCTLAVGDCGDVALSGTVELAPACAVSVTNLDFGTVLPNTPVTRTFTITNTGGGTLNGAVTESCDAFTVANGTYALTAGQSQTVTVSFQSATAGTFTCTLDTGGECGDVALSGTVELAPACDISVASLDFGTVLPGTPVTRTFTITNTGGGTLSGAVTESCGTYTVSNGTYALTAGQSQTVTVSFQSATAGIFDCSLDTGGSCADIAATAAAANIQMVTGTESACGAVDNLGHFDDSQVGFVPDWENGAIGLSLGSMGGESLTVSVVVGANAVWTGQVSAANWNVTASAVDLSDFYGQNIQMHLEVSDGQGTWNDNGSVCNWDLSFLTATELSMPQAFLLHEAAPNPFNPVTRLRVDLPQADHVRMTVSDLQGRQVAVLVDSELPAGSHDLSWQPTQVASGTYFVTVQCRQGVQVRKVLFLK